MKNTALLPGKQQSEKRMQPEEEFEIGAAYQFQKVHPILSWSRISVCNPEYECKFLGGM